MKDDNIKAAPAGFICPACEVKIEYQSTIQNPGHPPKKGDIVICFGCGSILKVGDGGLVKMMKLELNKLDKQSKSIIAMTCASVMNNIMQQKVAAAGRG